MKTKFLLRVIVLVCFFTLISISAYSEDFLFKSVLLKQEIETYSPPLEITCDGDTITASTDPVSFTKTSIMKTPDDFTEVSFKVFYEDDSTTVLKSYISKTPAQVNFNASTGAISFTLTDIEQSRKPLVVRVYLNNGSGPVYEKKQISTSQGNPIPIGTIMSYYGTDDNGEREKKLNIAGWFFCDGSRIDDVNSNILFNDEKGELKSFLGSDYFPDLRGVFLRGAGSNSYDPDSPRGIGSLQTEQVKFTAHNYEKVNSSTNSGNASVGLNTNTTTVKDGGGSSITVLSGASLSNGNHIHTISTSTASTTNPSGGTTETRPDNKAVMYIIKAR